MIPSTTVRIAAAQTPEFVGNIDAASVWLVSAAVQAEVEGAALLCLPEGFLQGYLTDEKSARRHAIDLASVEFGAILARLPKTAPMVVFGMIEIENGRLFNTAAVVDRGNLVGRYRKAHLLRGEQCFDAGNDTHLFEVNGLRFGINICYDTNFPEAAEKIAALGASLIVCPANNMLGRKTADKYKDLHNQARGDRCRETGLWLVSSDVTGKREGRISFGPTAILDPSGQVAAQLPLGEPGLLIFDLPIGQQATGNR